VSGFTDSDDTDPVFKSSGQAETGIPVLMKFTADDASSSSPPAAAHWTYEAPSDQSDDYVGSAKVVREAEDGTLMTLVGQQTALIKLMANGTLVWAKSYDEPNQGTDFVHTPNGTMVTGLRQYINKKVCPQGCEYVTGELILVSEDGSTTEWAHTFGNPPGGLNQYAGLEAGSPELVYTECWGIQATRDALGKVDGVVTACGTGIEGCSTPGLTRSLKEECMKDPRTTWRSLTMGFNLNGEVLWRRLDNFKDADTGPRVGTSANEYVFLRDDGSPVGITDEGFGVGLLVMSFNVSSVPTPAFTPAPTPPHNPPATSSSLGGDSFDIIIVLVGSLGGGAVMLIGMFVAYKCCISTAPEEDYDVYHSDIEYKATISSE